VHELDPQRLRVAAHELGHLVAYREAGIPVESITITGHGTRARGEVMLPRAATIAEERIPDYLVAVLAGREADRWWTDLHGMPRSTSRTFETDLRLFRRHFHGPAVRGLSESVLAARARKLVQRHTRLIESLAPDLARRGRLRGRDLRRLCG
jgi:hypothetical protein